MMDQISEWKTARRFCPGSVRELRLLRLGWLSVWRMEDLAALLGLGVPSVTRRLAAHGLTAEEAPGEMGRLLVAVMQDRAADGLVSAGEVREAALSLQRLAGTARVMQAVEKDKAGEDCENTDEEWRENALDELERMVSMDSEIETKAARSSRAEEDEGIGRGASDDFGVSRASDPRPRYTGAAAGPCADMVAFGRAWRGRPT